MLDFVLLNIGDWLMAWPKGIKTAVMVVLMILVFYFFLIRPQTQQAKKERAYHEGLKKGDRVMTAGGIHVTVVSSNETRSRTTVEAAPGVRMTVQTASLQPIPERNRAKA